MAEPGGSGKEQDGINSLSFHPATHSAARTSQQHTRLGNVLVGAQGSSRSRQEVKKCARMENRVHFRTARDEVAQRKHTHT